MLLAGGRDGTGRALGFVRPVDLTAASTPAELGPYLLTYFIFGLYLVRFKWCFPSLRASSKRVTGRVLAKSISGKQDSRERIGVGGT